MFSLQLLVIVLVTNATDPSASDDWLRFGGPAGNGVSAEKGWSSKGRAEPVWQTNVGLGYSSCAVRGKRLYTLGHDKEGEQDLVFCLDADTGEEVWTHAYPAKLMANMHGGGTLATPTLDGDFVYVSEREGQLLCLDAKSGELVWSKQPAKDLGATLPTWGFSASPLPLGERLILNYGVVAAYDKKSGELAWKTAKNYGHAYSTPAVCEHGGTPALAVFAGEGLALVAQEDGRELGFTPWKTQYDINAMTPVVLQDKLFISSGLQRGCALLEWDPELKVLWENKAMSNAMTGVIPWDGHLYGFDDKVLKCIDLAGKEVWAQRGLGQGALALADGRLIVLSEEGELVVADASPKGYHELSRTKVLDGAVCWTMPVLADGHIFCRNQAGDLVCLDHRPQ